jgi:hypothetical protein
MMDEQAGLLFFLPVIPLSGRAVEHSQSLLRQAVDETGARCGATYFTLDSDLTLAVVAIKFNREQAEATRAHQALDRLYQLFTASSFTPCRLDIDHAHWVDQLSPDTAARQLVRRVKEMPSRPRSCDRARPLPLTPARSDGCAGAAVCGSPWRQTPSCVPVKYVVTASCRRSSSSP